MVTELGHGTVGLGELNSLDTHRLIEGHMGYEGRCPAGLTG